MSLQPQSFTAVPAETARVARAVFPQGNIYMGIRDEIGVLYEDEAFAPLFSARGQPAEAPWRLALVTRMPYAAGLPDRQAADAVRRRIDWQYALNRELTDPGFDHTVLCEFRARLITGSAEQLLLDALLQVCRERKLLKARGRQRTDSTHVVAAIRTLRRLENVGTTLRHALNTLAVAAPEWVQTQSEPVWVERYRGRSEEYRLPKGTAERRAWAETVGADGHELLAALSADPSQEWLCKIPAVATLRQVWVQQYDLTPAKLQWRTAEAHGRPPSAVGLRSPHDPHARYSAKGGTTWVGYKGHLTETWDEEGPRLITQVETTLATVPDHAVLDEGHQHLAAKALLPGEHVGDGGYGNAELLVRSQQEHGVELWGPARPDTAWQAQAGKGFAATDFTFDWDQQHARCPGGQTSSSWQATTERYGKAQGKSKVAVRDCQPCAHRSECTRLERRILTVRPRDEFRALAAARQREKTAAYAACYAKRAGVEGSLSQAVRRGGLRRARYVGLAKTHLQNVLTAAALNLVRLSNWLAEVPLAKTRRSPFAKLMQVEPKPC
jgi:transposase